jgi:hypothetical protein
VLNKYRKRSVAEVKDSPVRERSLLPLCFRSRYLRKHLYPQLVDFTGEPGWDRTNDHLIAKKKGREIWYRHYFIRICKVERNYGRPEE